MSNQNIQLHGVFVRRVHFDTAALPEEAITSSQDRIDADMNIRSSSRALNGTDRFATTLALTVKAKVHGKEIMVGDFAVELVATLDGFDEATKQHALNVFLPNQLLPFLRELVANVSQRGGFPQIVVPALVLQPAPAEPQRPALPGTLKQLH